MRFDLRSVGVVLCSAWLSAWAASFPASALAWGDEGHEIVAAIAYRHLTPAARKKVDAILIGEKSTLTAPDFASRATWADKWRDSDRNGKKIHYNGTREWHFADMELNGGTLDQACFSFPALPAGKAASDGRAHDCVVNKIEQFSAELRDPKASAAERRLALEYLLHLVGDLHQPLHDADNKDRGGNSVPVLFGNHKVVQDRLNLHHYWDTELPLHLGKNAEAVARQLDGRISAKESSSWGEGSPRAWALESFNQAKGVAYDFGGLSERTDTRGRKALYLDAAYDRRALPVVVEQLSKGGIRLAAVLNHALD